MGIIYENDIKGIGERVDEFRHEGMFILFGEDVPKAPKAQKKFCYAITVKRAAGKIAAGQTLEIDDTKYKIVRVGDMVQKNLETVGHITVMFNGDASAGLPGTLVVEEADVPKLKVGSTIRITQ